MNLREAVLCQRLRARSRGELHPATEEDVRAVEEQLGFALPAMLRTLYLHVSHRPGYGIYDIPSSHQEPSSDPRIRNEQLGNRWSWEDSDHEPPSDEPAATTNPAPSWAYLEALRQHPGAYCSWGEDGFPEAIPDHWVYLARDVDSIWVLLDGDTGFLYYHEAEYYPQIGEEWTRVSFCAPSVEDWLKRELDASSDIRLRYHPRRKLTDVVNLDKFKERNPRFRDAPNSLEERKAFSARTAFGESRRLRVQNLDDEGPDPVEQAALSSMPAYIFDSPPYRPAAPKARQARYNHVQVEYITWKLEQARHQILRQLYRLMDLLESEDHARAATDQHQRSAWSEGALPETLEALIEADTHLRPINDRRTLGAGQLYRLAGAIVTLESLRS